MIFEKAAVGLVTVLVAAMTIHSVRAAPIDEAAQSKAEITKALGAIERALARGDDATTVSKMLYAENDLLVGEGEDAATRGLAGTIPDVQGWYDSLGPNGRKGCHYTIADPVVASATTFTSFILLRCKANPPVLPKDQELRMVYAWKKFPVGWRVVLEMWAPGKL